MYNAYYSVNSENVTQIKRYIAQILSYKIFSFCEQTLHKGLIDDDANRLLNRLAKSTTRIDASRRQLQSALEIRV